MNRIPKGYFQWRCRRGTKELDVLLTRFLDASYDNLSDNNLIEFKQFLEAQDTELWYWLSGKSNPKDEFNSKWVQLIRQI